jgi:hypothetical protein
MWQLIAGYYTLVVTGFSEFVLVNEIRNKLEYLRVIFIAELNRFAENVFPPN